MAKNSMSERATLPPDLKRALRQVRSVGAISGAGFSRESGIRTYRGKGGIYDDPVEGERTVEALSHETLAVDPDRTWRAVADLARQAVGARPGRAHRALAAIERKAERFVLLTQNVDELHQAAGSRNVIDIHGSIRTARCSACGGKRRFGRDELGALRRTPRCEHCSGPLRPDAVLFGELLPEDKVARLHRELRAFVPDLVLVVGTSALFPYIVEPALHARRRGKLTVEINPESTTISDWVDFSLRGGAGDFVSAIERALPSRKPRGRARDPLGRVLAGGRPDEMWWSHPPDDAGLGLEQLIEWGADLFDQQRFFEAHECFESVWNSSRLDPARREFWRGVTQFAVGCCHLQRGNREGALGVLARARENVSSDDALVAPIDDLLERIRDPGDRIERFPCFPRRPH